MAKFLDENGLHTLWDGGAEANHNGGIKAKIEAAKNAAISTASSDATSKVSAAKTELETSISAEATTRANEITRVEGLISDEAKARANADNTLDGRIDSSNGRITTLEGFFKAVSGGGTNVGVAEKAEADASGNVITTTYATKEELQNLSTTVTGIGGNFDSNGYANRAIGDKNGDDITTTYIRVSAKGVANGVATLDANAKVPAAQLPSYVDDVVEGYYYNSNFYNEAAHTTQMTGEAGKIYTDLPTNKVYRWSGSQYTEISASLAIGTTAGTAYDGAQGAANAAAIAALQNDITTINDTYIPKVVALGNANADKIEWHKTNENNVITWGIKTTGTTGVSKPNAGFYLTTDVSKANKNSIVKLFAENDSVEIGNGSIKLISTSGAISVTGSTFKFNTYDVMTSNDYITTATINSILNE